MKSDAIGLSPKFPEFEDDSGRVWQPLTIHFALGFCGVYAEIECQTPDMPGKSKTFIYRSDKELLSQWDSAELVDCKPINGEFTAAISNLFGS